jgi:hypothetical protein
MLMYGSQNVYCGILSALVVNTTAENQLKVTVGQYDAQLGMGYGELAGLSRSLHKSQGAGTQSVAGIRTEYFAHVMVSLQKQHFLTDTKTWTSQGNADIDQSWIRLFPLSISIILTSAYLLCLLCEKRLWR